MRRQESFPDSVLTMSEKYALMCREIILILFFHYYVQFFLSLRYFFEFRLDLNSIKFSNTTNKKLKDALKYQIVIYKIRK